MQKINTLYIRSKIDKLIVFVLFFLVSSYSYADAICKDGWKSKSEGSGTCSWHGGIAAAYIAAQRDIYVRHNIGSATVGLYPEQLDQAVVVPAVDDVRTSQNAAGDDADDNADGETSNARRRWCWWSLWGCLAYGLASDQVKFG